MARQVDGAYWEEYFATYNNKQYDALVNNFYPEDTTFQNPKYQMTGRQAIAEFFREHHINVKEVLTPLTVVITPEVACLEFDGVFSAECDLPDFHVMPLELGKPVKMGMGVFYHLEGDRIAPALVYWMRPAL
jgi:hypothetical protein